MPDSVLRIKDLLVERGGREVLHRISLDVHRGEITALLGANGAGKSSLVLTTCGMLPAKSGSVLTDGIELSDDPLPAWRAQVYSISIARRMRAK